MNVLPVVRMTTSCWERLRVACVGDSLTRGDGLHEHPPAHRVPSQALKPRQRPLRERGNYPIFLGRLLGHHRRVEVRNFGHGGTTACNSSGGRGPPYSQVREFHAALRYRPHLVILMLGTNDAKRHFWRSKACGPDGLRNGLADIIKAFLDAASPPRMIFVLQPPDILASRVFGIERKLLPEVRAVISDFSRSHGENAGASQQLVLEPLRIPRVAALYATDSLHLSANGSALLACAAWRRLRGIFGGALSRWCAAQPARASVQASKRVPSSGKDGASGAPSRPRSCWDPFCARPSPSPYDDPDTRACEAESGIRAPFLFTGMPCHGHAHAHGPRLHVAARLACSTLWREHGWPMDAAIT